MSRLVFSHCCIVLFYSIQTITFTPIKASPLDNREKISIQVHDKELLAITAKTPLQRTKGLMNVKSLPDNEAMLFIFPSSQKVHFWMKNMLIPIDIAYFDSRRRLIQVRTMYPDRGHKVFHSRVKIRYCLETTAGWFERNKIPPRAKLKIFKTVFNVY